MLVFFSFSFSSSLWCVHIGGARAMRELELAVCLSHCLVLFVRLFVHLVLDSWWVRTPLLSIYLHYTATATRGGRRGTRDKAKETDEAKGKQQEAETPRHSPHPHSSPHHPHPPNAPHPTCTHRHTAPAPHTTPSNPTAPTPPSCAPRFTSHAWSSTTRESERRQHTRHTTRDTRGGERAKGRKA